MRLSQVERDKLLVAKDQRLATFDSAADESDKKIASLR